MGRDSKFRIWLSRRRHANWEAKEKLKILFFSFGILALILLVIFSFNTINFDKTKIVPIADSSINEEIRANLESMVNIYEDDVDLSIEAFDNLVDIYDDKDKLNEIQEKDDIDVALDNEKQEDKEESVQIDRVYKNNKIKKDDITFTALGQIMMGSAITENLDYHYNLAFKSIIEHTRYADFTYGTLLTNITNLDKISDVRSKYLVTKSIRSAFTSLGVDALNIATPHITDYDKTIFTTTIDTLKNNNIYMTGINDSTLYIDVCGKKIAIVAALSSYIGNKNDYLEFGINLYDYDKMTQDIIDAKDRADIVIVDISWGRDDVFSVTPSMQNMAKSAIDAGASLVIGSNALGIYPIQIYNGVPIIYSTGSLINDSDFYLDQNSYIWQFNINKENKVNKLTMIPTCMQNKTYVKKFDEVSKELCDNYNTMINKWNIENGLNSTVNSDGTITVIF